MSVVYWIALKKGNQNKSRASHLVPGRYLSHRCTAENISLNASLL